MMNVNFNTPSYSAKLNCKQSNQKTQTAKQQVAFSGVVAKTTGRILGVGVATAPIAIGVGASFVGAGMGALAFTAALTSISNQWIAWVAALGSLKVGGDVVNDGLHLANKMVPRVSTIAKGMENAVENLSNKSPDVGKLAQKAMNGISRIIKK